MSPFGATVMPRGVLSFAEVAGPLSPENPTIPDPIGDVIVPPGLIIRTFGPPPSQT